MVKENKGFLCMEVKQVISPGYCPGLLARKQCLCFQSDSIRVFSRLAGSGATPEMKNYTLNILRSQITSTFS